MGFQVGTAEVAVVPVFKGFRREVDREVGDAGNSAGQRFSRGFGDQASATAGSSGGRVGRAFASGMTKAIGALAIVGLASKLGGFAKDGIAQARDLAESGSKVNQIFGTEGAKALDRFSDGAAQKLGQTKLAVLEAAGAFGVFGKSAGKTGKPLADFSSQMVTLSADLASFHNTSPEEAVDALAAALRGESEPMRRYGVLLDDASMRQKALQLGLIKTTKEALTPQQKVLASQALIMEQTKDAQGDFAKTSGGLANQQRILSAQWSEMKTQLGTALLPVVTRVVTVLNNHMIPAFQWLQRLLSPLGARLAAFAAQIRGAFSGQSAGGLVAAFRGVLTWFQTTFMPAFSGVVVAYRGYLTTIATVVGQLVSGMMSRIRPMLPQIVAVFTQVGQAVTAALGLVQAVVTRITSVISAIWSRWGGTIMNVAAWAFSRLLAIVQPALSIITNIISLATNIIQGNWSGAWSNVKAILAGAVALIRAQVQTMTQAIQTLMRLGMDRLKAAARSGVDGVVGFFKGLPGRITSALSGLKEQLFSAGSAIVQRLVDGLKSKLAAVGDAAKNIASKVANFLPHSPAKEGPFSGSGWGGWGEAIGDEWAVGLRSRESALRAAANRVARAASPNPSQTAPGGRATPSFSNSFTIHGPDADEVVSRAMSHLDHRARVMAVTLPGGF